MLIFAAKLGQNILIMRRPLIVSQISEALRSKVPQATTLLYGSEARGDARTDSDIDLLILLPVAKVSYRDRDEIIEALYDIELKNGVLISPYIISEADWNNRPFLTPFYLNVTRDAINLTNIGEYERRIG